MKKTHLKRNFLLIGLLLGIINCNAQGLFKFGKSQNENNLSFQTRLVNVDSNNVAKYECNHFISSALNNYTIYTLKQEFKFLNYTKIPTENIHNPAVIDTVYTFSNNRNILHLYRARQKDFIFSLDVTNSKFILYGGIKTGLSKADFSQKFNITESIDEKVKITDTQGLSEFLFYFKRNKLVRISANLYLD